MTPAGSIGCGPQHSDKICPISRTPCPRECIYSHVLESIRVGILLLDMTHESVIYENTYSMELFRGTTQPGDYRGILSLLLPATDGMPSESADPIPKTLHLGARILGYTVYPIEDGYLLILVRDITDIRDIEAERALHAAAVESATDAIAITDTQGVMSYVNGAFERMTGYKRQEAIGLSIEILNSGKQSEDLLEQIWSTLAEGQAWSGRMINRKKDGSLYTEECAIYPLKDADGKIVNYVARKRDITEKLRLEAIAEAVHTMNNYGYVFSEIRHEIGNPINSLKMIITLLRRGIDRYSREEVLTYYDHAMESISRSELILKSMKKFYMFESPELQDVGAAEFFQEVLPHLTGDCTEKGISFSLHIEEGVTSLHIDPKALRQALANVIGNAVESFDIGKTGAGQSSIAMEVTGSADLVRIRVSDNGRGMTKEEQSKLFTPFFSSKDNAAGLGLVIARKMLAKMNGTIEIASSPGAGTAVDIVVPSGLMAPACEPGGGGCRDVR